MSSDHSIGAFAHIPKTAGLQVSRLLQEYHGSKHLAVDPRNRYLYDADDLAFDLRVHRRVVSLTGHPLRPHIDYGLDGDRLRWYTILRDPIARYLSHFMHEVTHRGMPLDLPQWIRPHTRRNFQVRVLAGEENLEAAVEALHRMVVVGLSERLGPSLVLIRFALGWEGLDITRPRSVNVSAESLREEVYIMGRRHMAEIRAENELDLELYHYALETLWPQQVAQYGGDERLDADVADEVARASAIRRRIRRASYLGYRHVVQQPLAQARRALSRAASRQTAS